MTIESIFNTFAEFEQDLREIYTTYKRYSDRQLAKVKHLATWQDMSSVVTEDQQYRMSLFLDEKLVPEVEKGEVCNHF